MKDSDTREDVQMANEDRGECQPSAGIGEIQIKVTKHGHTH